MSKKEKEEVCNCEIKEDEKEKQLYELPNQTTKGRK